MDRGLKDKMKNDLNNFYAYLPGGYYRLPEYDNPKRKKIINDVDKLLSETNFDIKTYTRIERIRSKNTDLGIKIIRTQMELKVKDEQEVKRAMHYLERADKFVKIRDEMIYPIYEKLIELGYDEHTLTS